MVVTVKLRGLNIRQSRGKWYVSIRSTGEPLLKGFEGTRDDLERKLEDEEVLRLYTTLKLKDRSRVYADGTLGALVAWFKKDCPRWHRLSEASKQDYEKTFTYLEPENDTPLTDITQADVYEVRDRAALAKWPRFADKLVSHLSTMFREAVKKRQMTSNPAAGVESVHRADPNANHEWKPADVALAFTLAPEHLLTPMTIAYYQAFRGQTISPLLWSVYVPDPITGRAFDLTAKKNNELAWFPCEPETIRHLDSLKRRSVFICLNSDGVPWRSEKVMQGAVSDYLTGLKKVGLIDKRCTLHGLRVSRAASVRRMGLDVGVVSNVLGDRSARMGEHYTRHVERDRGRLIAWKARNKK